MTTPPSGRARRAAAASSLAVAIGISAGGCAAGVSAVGASAYGKGSLYRSASVYVQLAPDNAFEPAVKHLLERDDIEITGLDEANNRCEAVFGDRSLTLRSVEYGPQRTRLTIMVGSGNDADANQRLADRLVQDICRHLGRPACEPGRGGS